ncbi:hypothetical protein M8C21_023107 [Ambrosia artemisiifolia]|uniref:O-fucosyltransferase family protein n=1 Tax=Ambrosia artemisiifolia TaxID=4212 RepID=A0AAD5GTP9_AMBAR|nr:hypothetical protein M8C21_023107 [Ambrosia artemisiifolia]
MMKKKGVVVVVGGGGWNRGRRRSLAIGILVAFLLTNLWMLSRIQHHNHSSSIIANNNNNDNKLLRFFKSNSSSSSTLSLLPEDQLPNIAIAIAKGKKKPSHQTAYARLLYKAAHALADNHYKAAATEPKDLWLETYHAVASLWHPCAHQRVWKPSQGNNGYIMVTANGGINQQRVAFADIYQEDYFIHYLQPDIRIVKELPKHLQSLDLEAIGSLVTDVDIAKEARPSFYLKYILPLLTKNKVVHFVGFGNRLASDPIPYHLQRLRCRCNFHALQFTPKIQATAALLIQRMRQNATHSGILDENLVGPFAKSKGKIKKDFRYLALHLRFEIDMVAHSLCDFGGGEEEKKELQAYREIHFPGLVELNDSTKIPSPERLKAEGLCPLMPEETVLMLAGLGFKRETRIYLAGAHIYGGKSRLNALTTLFPNMVTKEDLLSPSEIEPFLNFSSQLAALDFITCTASDVFAMTDSGSQLSSLVSGYRVYYGGGKMPTIRPNKRRLADIFMKNDTIEWKVFETRIRKAVRQNKRVFSRPVGRSVYRYPRCSECMCNTQEATLPIRHL